MPKTTEVERIPVHPGSLFFHEHLARYNFALKHVRPGRVLDIACGTGYGADLFAHLSGFSAIGADLDSNSVYAARKAFPDPVVRFCVASGIELPFNRHTFQNIVSLETIEHVEDDRGLLRELVRVMVPDGVLVLSTPNRLYSVERAIENPYHVREYIEEELRQLLVDYFGRVALYYQGFADRYHADVRGYADSIESRKRQLPLALRLALRRVYQPAKGLFPIKIRNYAIGKLLKLRYPQPDPADITISVESVIGASNFVLVCEEPR